MYVLFEPHYFKIERVSSCNVSRFTVFLWSVINETQFNCGQANNPYGFYYNFITLEHDGSHLTLQSFCFICELVSEEIYENISLPKTDNIS